MKYHRLLALLLCVALFFGLLASCSKDADDTPPTTTEPTPESSKAPVSEGDDEGDDEPTSVYPIPGQPELSFYLPLHEPLLAALALDYNEYPVRQEMERRTGVHIKWRLPNLSTNTEQFNLMAASQDYTDIISNPVYGPGLDQAVMDGIFLRLNEIMDEHAPNYLAMINEREDAIRGSLTDDGNRVGFAMIFEWMGKRNPPANGIAWRRDVAKDYGWETAPTSVAELNEYLDVLLSNGHSGFFAPPTYGFEGSESSGVLPGFFDAATRFLNVDGKVQYGPLMPGFKDYVIQMKEWYDKGILFEDFMVQQDLSRQSANWADDTFLVGIAYNPNIGTVYYDTGVSTDPDFYIQAIAPLKTKNGEAPKHGSRVAAINASPVVISTTCEQPEIAVRYLDYFFSEEGALLANYGVEGITFEWGEGESGFWRWGGNPQYTDYIMNNPDHVSPVIAIMAYCWTVGPVYRPWLPETPDLEINQKIWAEGVENYVWNMPELMTIGAEDSARYSALLTDAETFCQETVVKLITGAIPIEEYETKFIDKLIKEMKVDEMVAIQQAALDRYFAR